MNVAIISCFDTFLDRQKALVKLFLDRGDQVTAFLSDFQHVSKSYRTAGLDGFTLVHAVSYRKKFVALAHVFPTMCMPHPSSGNWNRGNGIWFGRLYRPFPGQALCRVQAQPSPDETCL